ncbi:MAG: GNAT family N-acetyltransferase [Flavipsychrobacter sp.]
MYTIRLISTQEIHSIIPLLKLLDETKAEDVLQSRLEDMVAKNYSCVGVYDDNKLIGISGLWILNKYYVGKHLEVDNVIILPEYRSKGIGDLLMKWIFDYAISIGCIASELNCYTSNHKGLRFWINKGYKIIGYHMQKML